MTIKIGKFVNNFPGSPEDGCDKEATLTKDGNPVGWITACYTNGGRWANPARIESYAVELETSALVSEDDNFKEFLCRNRNGGDVLKTPAEAKRLLREWADSVTK